MKFSYIVFFISLFATVLLYGQQNVTIIAGGDIMLGTTYPEAFLPPDKGKTLFNHVTAILRDGDIVFGNLEETLNTNCKCVKHVKRGKVYAFRSPPEYVSILKKAGFNLISLANNHTMDFGRCGLESTKRVLLKAGIKFVSKDGEVATFNIKGIKVAAIGVSFGPPPGSILYPDMITPTIKELAKEFQIVIVSVHNGAEGTRALHIRNQDEIFFGTNRGNVVKFAHMAIDAGADLIIGHGPHVPRAMELYKGKLIIYSLGNFCTYGGMSLTGPKGITPIVKVILDNTGNFIKGKIYSFMQPPPGCPILDPENRALKLIKNLTKEDFPESGLIFLKNGDFLPVTIAK